MKILKSILITSCLLIAATGMAQSDDGDVTPATAQGNIVVGGSSNFNFTRQKPKTKTDSGGTQDGGSNSSSFSFSPSVGYFVVDNLALGAGISFSSSRFKADDFDFQETRSSIVFSPFARYYFSKGNIKPFLQGSAGIGAARTKESGNSNDFEFKSSIFSYSFDGGVAIFIADNISVDLGVGYASASSKPTENNDDNFRSITNGFGFNAGFNIFF